MSFSNCGGDFLTPGRINGNPLHNLCERACIEAKKVFDGCMMQRSIEGVVLALSDFTPTSPTLPLNFVSAANSSAKPEITAFDVTALPDRNGLSRVRATVSIPMTVNYTDASGVQGVAKSSFVVDQDVVLFVPTNSIMPYTLEAVCGVVCTRGSYVAENTFSVTACVTLILKVVMDVELMIPTYGYCQLPPCQPFNEEVCSGFFETPLYPR